MRAEADPLVFKVGHRSSGLHLQQFEPEAFASYLGNCFCSKLLRNRVELIMTEMKLSKASPFADHLDD